MPLPRMSRAFLPPSFRRRLFQWSGFIFLVYPFFMQICREVIWKGSESGFMKRLDQSETSDFLPGGAASDEPPQSGATPHWWHASAQNLFSNARIQVLSGI